MKLGIAAGIAAALLIAGVWMFKGRLWPGGTSPSSRAALAPVNKPADRATSADPVVRGEDVYYRHCLVCHSPDTDDATNGPSLKNYFNRPPAKLSNGTLFPRTDAAIRDLFLKGTRNMPPMSKDLSEQETADLLAFLHTR